MLDYNFWIYLLLTIYKMLDSNVNFVIWFVSFENVYVIMWPIRNVIKLACLDIGAEMIPNWN